VEDAKRRLAAAAPGGRAEGIPLAEALAGFEEGIGEASAQMDAWRVDEVSAVWPDCSRGIDEALRRAERLRLGAAPDGYENLYGVLADLMEPLEVFRDALRRFRELRP
jgi:hypothetical protein